MDTILFPQELFKDIEDFESKINVKIEDKISLKDT